MSLWSKSSKLGSAREQMQIQEVRDGILVLPHEQYRVVMETSSINFELKSEAEQDVLIDGFQHVLNSLPCAVQILVRVRELDVDSYIEQLEASKVDEKEQAYQDQIKSYSEFIRSLVSGNKILSRKFYVIIPYHSVEKQTDFSVIKEQLQLAQGIVAKGLEKLGMKVTILDTLAVLNLFYSTYNSRQYKTQPLQGNTIKNLLTHFYA